MPKFQYIGDEPRGYPFLLDGAPLAVEPNDVVELDADPADGRWEAVKSSQKAVKADSEAANDTPDPTPSN